MTMATPHVILNINVDDDDARLYGKKWRRLDDLAVTVNDAAPWL